MQRLLAIVAAVIVSACGGAPSQSVTASPTPATPAAAERPTATPAADLPLVVFLGDSLSAGLGLPQDEAFPAVVGARLAERGEPIRVINAGVSGDTTAGGLARLDWLLRQRPDVVVVELGANDGLRGLPVATIEHNLRAVVQRSRAAGARVLLLGMRIPPSYGEAYAGDFAAIYPRLADELGVALVPFLLDGVAAVPELNQGDQIHPNADGHRRVAANVVPALEPLVGADRAGRP